jgi:hypothetical protein
MFLCKALSAQHWVHKNSAVSYFLTDFNNLHTILTRIVSKFLICIQNRIPTTAAQSASFLKCIIIKLLFDRFLLDFNDLHIILTRIVSPIRTCLKKKSDYRSLNSDDFSVRHWISAPKLSRVDDLSCHFFGGAAFSLPLISRYIKKHSKGGHVIYDLHQVDSLGKM